MIAGAGEFDAYYQNLYSRRWPRLRESLLAAPESVPYGEGLRKPYLMDGASILAARTLRLPQGEDGRAVLLDACAAPGGKSLVTASRMGALRLLANEFSGERRRRLSLVLDEHLEEDRRKQVTLSGFDASAQGARRSEWGRFAGILLDAPCSSERHVIRNKRALGEWTAARPRSLAKRQWALLSAAFLLLRPGASLVYATCALSAEENDPVMERLFAKYGAAAIPDPPDFPEGEETRWGRLILPDRCNGMGPMYVARIRKAPEWRAPP
jgi:16S rRNA (cytosine1407-C5)-methyltransferase